MRAVLVAAILLSVALAGCSGSDSTSTNSGSPDDPRSLEELEMQANELEVESSADKAIIRGIVVDAAIRPLMGATITLRSLSDTSAEPLEAVTTDNGLFGFGNLEPGAYSILVKRLGYFDAQTSVDLKAGVKDDPVVKIILEADPAGTPFVEVMKYDGFIECSVVVVAVRYAACSEPSTATDLACAVAGVCLGNITNDQFLARHPVDPNNIHFVQSEMVWDSSQALGARMNAIPGHWNPESGDWNDLESIDGTSPIIMQFDQDTSGPIADAGGFQVRVFSSYPAETEPPGGILWGVGLTLQQEFVIVTHAFHGFTPPEGWTFTADGSPRVPA